MAAVGLGGSFGFDVVRRLDLWRMVFVCPYTPMVFIYDHKYLMMENWIPMNTQVFPPDSWVGWITILGMDGQSLQTAFVVYSEVCPIYGHPDHWQEYSTGNVFPCCRVIAWMNKPEPWNPTAPKMVPLVFSLN